MVISLEGFAVASRKLPLLMCLLAFIALAPGCRDAATALTGLEDARRLTADLRVQFGKSADATSRAVMAGTDEASIAFAHESEQASRAAERDAAALSQLLSRMKFSQESQILREFSGHFSEYRKLDDSIRQLAVENSNLKAQALSFGPASQAAVSFADSLKAASASFSPKERCRVDGLVAQALLAVREIQILYGPHIAERDDAPMTRMEKEMADLDATARDALKALGESPPPEARSALSEALTALDRFKTASAQIVALSRRNSNVVSLELVLSKRPPLAVACDDRLHALRDALAKERSGPTR